MLIFIHIISHRKSITSANDATNFFLGLFFLFVFIADQLIRAHSLIHSAETIYTDLHNFLLKYACMKSRCFHWCQVLFYVHVHLLRWVRACVRVCVCALSMLFHQNFSKLLRLNANDTNRKCVCACCFGHIVVWFNFTTVWCLFARFFWAKLNPCWKKVELVFSIE